MTEAKSCTNCHEKKPFDQYHRSAKASDGHASWCKLCANRVVRENRKRTYSPEKKRKWQLQTRYNLTPAAVDELSATQGGHCALCPASLHKFHIDHDHNTGTVRGLLCHRCNIRLGGWDDLQWRQLAMVYLGIS